MKLPQARCENIVEQRLNKEIILYDLTRNKAYNLNETAAIVYQYCDGKTTLEELAVKESLSEKLILYSLTKLEKENLISFIPGLPTEFEGLSRRQIIHKIGVSGLALLPVISMLVAPSALQAQSGSVALLAPGSPCGSPTQCQSVVCMMTFVPGPPMPGPFVPGPPVPGPPIIGPGGILTPGPPMPGPPMPGPQLCI